MLSVLSGSNVALIVAIALLATILIPLSYNAFFHPLRNFPGPFTSRLSVLPATYHRFNGLQHKWLKALHDQYGPVVRYSPNSLSYVDPAAWRDIYGHKVQGRGDMPKHGVSTPLLGGKHSILSMNDSDHTRARRLLSHAMSDRAIKEQQTILETYIGIMIEKIRDVAKLANGTAVDMVALYNFTTFDVMADLAFGEPMGMLAAGEWTPWMKAINDGTSVAIKVKVLNELFPFLTRIFLFFLPRNAREATKTHIDYSKTQVDKRLARETQRPDFWTYILRNQGKEQGNLTEVENHAMGTTLMFAGSETTATAASGLTRFLLEDPGKFAKLANEIRGAFGSTVDMDMDKLASLPYLQCCIKEAMRMYPPVPVGRNRFVPAGGRTVGEQFVPEGTIVHVTHWAAYRTEINWHRAGEFIPERWLPENMQAGPFAGDRRDVLQPFSFGPRNCIGKNLAYHELRMLVASVFWHFDLEMGVSKGDWFDHTSYIVHDKPPLMVVPRVAKNAEI